MLFVLLFLALFFQPANASFRMTVMPRVVLVHNKKCFETPHVNGDHLHQNLECVRRCVRNVSCELVYFDDVSCNLCAYGDISTVIRSAAGLFAAALKDQYGTFCVHKSYTLSQLTSISTQEIAPTTTAKTCAANYKLFLRGDEQLCLGVEYESLSSTITKTEGMSLCEKKGGFITGPNTIEERNYFRDITLALFKSEITSMNGIGVWTDGNRIESCSSYSSLLMNNFCLTIEAFEFEDKSLTNLTGYNFIPGQPDGPTQKCLQLIVSSNSFNGLFDDQNCDSILGYFVSSKAVACGIRI